VRASRETGVYKNGENRIFSTNASLFSEKIEDRHIIIMED